MFLTKNHGNFLKFCGSEAWMLVASRSTAGSVRTCTGIY